VNDRDVELFPIEKVDGWADVLIILSNHKVYASRNFESPLLSFDKLINAECDAICDVFQLGRMPVESGLADGRLIGGNMSRIHTQLRRGRSMG
jgi:hypothetical protein